jgi:MOSC domain-containing protein YiiM
MARTDTGRAGQAGSTRELLAELPQVGRLESISLRTHRHGPVVSVDAVQAIAGLGLDGDHRTHGRDPSPTASRQVTLIQAEHLPVVAALAGIDRIDATQTRRNLLVSGINLAALRTARFSIGGVVLEGSGHCHPCSIMETTIGPGALQAMRGHGGITARIVEGGRLQVGDEVRAIELLLRSDD